MRTRTVGVRRQARRASRVDTVALDIGGTFSDFLRLTDEGVVLARKVPTTPRRPEVAVLDALRALGGASPHELVHATTIATNALLGQRHLELPPVALVTTRGFRDVIEIGRQNRPGLYDLDFHRPRPLVPRRLRFTLDERTGATGRRRRAVQPRELSALRERLARGPARAVAVCLLHSYLNAANERAVGAGLRRGGLPVSLSSDVAPEPREFERTSTTVVNAALLPVVSRYVEALSRGLPPLGIRSFGLMSSAGGLVSSAEAARRPVAILESGPAAGVLAAAELGRRLGLPRLISFDMGGTTAKAGTVIDGRVETTGGLEVGGQSHHGRTARGSGYPVRFPFLNLAEVSAGGGTIVHRDVTGALEVGPLSAGADPGPACYRRGGTEPTLTDAAVALGWLGDALLGGTMPIDRGAAARALGRLGDPVRVAEEALGLADLEMARAIRLVTVERGLDPTRFVLVAFGGAGPQHAARVADELGIRSVVVPPRPGFFSASGLLCADWRYERRLAFPRDLREGWMRLSRRLLREHPGARLEFSADCRYAGQGSELAVPLRSPDFARLRRAFRAAHRSTFGFDLDRPIEVVTLRAFATRARPRPPPGRPGDSREGPHHRPAVFGGRATPLEVWPRAALRGGMRRRGPAAVEEYDSTTVVPVGWTVAVGGTGELTLLRERA